MTRTMNLVWKLRIWNDTKGQDLIEYALMAGFVAVAAGAIMPGVANSISVIFSKISSSMSAASNPGQLTTPRRYSQSTSGSRAAFRHTRKRHSRAVFLWPMESASYVLGKYRQSYGASHGNPQSRSQPFAGSS